MDQSENIQGKNIQTNKISYSVTVDGELLSCPLVAAIGSNDGEIMFYGRLKWGGRSIADVCEATDIRFSEEKFLRHKRREQFYWNILKKQ